MLVVSMLELLPVKTARSGDPEAWDTLFKRFQLPLYAYVFEWVHDQQYGTVAPTPTDKADENASKFLMAIRAIVNEALESEGGKFE